MLFISPQKLFLLSGYLRFCLDFLVMYQNDLIRQVNVKFYDVTPNISRKKANHRMKFGQLTKYNVRNIFPEKSSSKCGRGTIPRPFSGYQS